MSEPLHSPLVCALLLCLATTAGCKEESPAPKAPQKAATHAEDVKGAAVQPRGPEARAEPTAKQPDATVAPAAPEAPAAPAEIAPAAEPPAEPAGKRVYKHLCEVEMSGAMLLPKGVEKDGNYYVYVSDTDCLADDAHILERTRAADQGTFFVEVFPPCGTKLTLCGAIETGEKSVATLFGKYAKIIDATGEGEIYEGRIEVPLVKGAPHTFPAIAKK